MSKLIYFLTLALLVNVSIEARIIDYKTCEEINDLLEGKEISIINQQGELEEFKVGHSISSKYSQTKQFELENLTSVLPFQNILLKNDFLLKTIEVYFKYNEGKPECHFIWSGKIFFHMTQIIDIYKHKNTTIFILEYELPASLSEIKQNGTMTTTIKLAIK